MTSIRTTSRSLSLLLAAATALAVMGGFVDRASALQPWQISVGYDKLVAAVPSNILPRGQGMAVSFVEAGTIYMADPSLFVEFASATDPLGQIQAFTDRSGLNSTSSPHAVFEVASFMVGNTSSLTPAANAVDIYQAENWMQNQLNFQSSAEPVAQPYKVQNFSWVGSWGNNTDDQSVLRRVDYLIETGDVTMVVGANNNPGVPSPTLAHPNMLVHSYNAIVAGRTDGGHSRGVTNSVYGPGRFRPDLVSNGPFTSRTSAQISSAATLIRQTLAGSNGDRSETTKAILMAGATKTEFLPGVVGSVDGPANAAGFIEPATGLPNNWAHTATQPLDDIFGAGELNIYNSYLMTVGGQNAGSATTGANSVKNYGWDYKDFKANASAGDVFYNFEVPLGSKAKELSVLLSWNVKITDSNPASPFVPTESLQNLDLRLYRPGENVNIEPLDSMELQPRRSVSTIDNVEHIYLTNLDPGIYTLKVSGAGGWDYGLAWRMSTLFDQANADFDGSGAVDGQDYLVWQQNLGLLVGAAHSQGDADGDGDVDRDDLVIFNAQLAMAQAHSGAASSGGGASGANGHGASHGVPEPGTISLSVAAAGLGAHAARAWRRRRSA